MTFPAETVTQAKLRLTAVPGLDKPAAVITLDNGFDHTKPNTMGPGGLASLSSAIDAALAADPAFIAVTGKPYIFCVGADLMGIGYVTTREQALEIANLGHSVYAKLRNSTIPTFAFVNGAAMGGGVELALHCHYRTVSAGAAAISLPEVSLGLVPGWGGTQLLPNLVGVVPAAQVVVQNPLMMNKQLKPRNVLELGIADAMFAPADFLESSLAWAAGVVSGKVQVERAEVDRSEMWDAVVGFARMELDKKIHGASKAATRALDLLERAKAGVTEEGLAAEREALADLIMSQELRAGIYSFDLVQRRAKRPAGAPDKGYARDVTKVGVVGAGLMASQLALLFAKRLEVPVVMTDLDQARVDKGVAYVHAEIDKALGKGRMSRLQADKLRTLVTGTVDKSTFADADFVIEAVFEELSVKKKVWAEIEEIVSPECILATNTSSLSVSAMAADLKHPERIVGFHFFNPVALMPLLEIVRAEKTNDATLATAFAVGKQLKKSCVLVKDAPAFVFNRILTRFFGEIYSAIDLGTPLDVANTALDPLGLPMRPLELLQLVGPAVAAHVGNTLHQAYPDRFTASPSLEKIVAAGLPLIVDEAPNPEVVALLQGGETPLTAEEVRERALAALAEEIRIMLDEGVVADSADIDLCLILGGGWPFYLGGITPYLDRTGVSEKVTGKRFAAPGVATLP